MNSFTEIIIGLILGVAFGLILGVAFGGLITLPGLLSIMF